MNILTKYIMIFSLLISLSVSSVEADANQYGSPYDDTIPVKPISFIFENAGANGKVFSFQGVVTAQCKNDGCWFKLKDNTREVQIDLKPYDFKTPLGIAGKKVKVNGRVTAQGGNVKVDAISVIILE